MKNVVLIGDSIRVGYQDRVRELLGPDVTVYAPEENARYTKYALWGMFSWMAFWGNPKIDVIHWNTGIWDLHRCTADGQVFTPLKEYVETNRRLLTQMQSYCDKLIWATTIPGSRVLDRHIPVNYLFNTHVEAPNVYLTDYMDVWNADVCKYNAAVSSLMKQNGVTIDDHYSALIPDTDRYISDDGIHPSEAGYEILAQLTANSILQML